MADCSCRDQWVMIIEDEKTDRNGKLTNTELILTDKGGIMIDFNHVPFDDDGDSEDPIEIFSIEIPRNKRQQFIAYLREVAESLERNNEYLDQISKTD